MSVFMLCERALGLIRGKRLDLAAADKNRLEALDYDGLVSARAQEEAVSCARHFAGVRDRLLSSQPWVFARKSAAPAQLAGSPPAGWKVSYSLPADCLKVLAVTTTDGRRSLFRHYEIIGRILAANVAPITITYTARIADTNLWDGLFADAFCSLLAGEMGAEVLGEPQLVSMMEQRAAASIQAARAAGLIQEMSQLPFEMPEYLDYSGVPTGHEARAWRSESCS
jgi:hypothetical protein